VADIQNAAWVKNWVNKNVVRMACLAVSTLLGLAISNATYVLIGSAVLFGGAEISFAKVRNYIDNAANHPIMWKIIGWFGSAGNKIVS
jgi:hypothetical protein